jgi:hypothetical protein
MKATTSTRCAHGCLAAFPFLRAAFWPSSGEGSTSPDVLTKICFFVPSYTLKKHRTTKHASQAPHSDDIRYTNWNHWRSPRSVEGDKMTKIEGWLRAGEGWHVGTLVCRRLRDQQSGGEFLPRPSPRPVTIPSCRIVFAFGIKVAPGSIRGSPGCCRNVNNWL